MYLDALSTRRSQLLIHTRLATVGLDHLWPDMVWGGGEVEGEVEGEGESEGKGIECEG